MQRLLLQQTVRTPQNPSERCHLLKICDNCLYFPMTVTLFLAKNLSFYKWRPFFCSSNSVLHDSCPPLDFDDVDEAECKAEFHVKKRDLPRLVQVLQLPPTFTCHQVGPNVVAEDCILGLPVGCGVVYHTKNYRWNWSRKAVRTFGLGRVISWICCYCLTICFVCWLRNGNTT